MSAPRLPGAPPDPASHTGHANAATRAREIQGALKSIVFQTASTLRVRTQLARLQTSVPASSAAAAASVNESSSSVERLTGECTRYLSLVHGLRDYMLHAQAALEIELEAATQREAEEARKAAEAAAEAIRRQQQADEEAQKKAKEEAERKRVEDVEKAARNVTDGGMKEEGNATGANETRDQDADISSGPRTPPLPAATHAMTDAKPSSSDEAKKKVIGNVAGDAIVIDSDGDDDEDDVPLAFVPKPGAADSASKAIDLTESPALANAANPLATDVGSTAAAAIPPADVASTGPAATQEPSSSSDTASAAPAGIPGLDLSAFGINLSSLTNLPDLSSLGIPSFAATTTSATDSSSLAPPTDFSELEKMMAIDTASSATSQPASASNATAPGAQELSSLGGFSLGSSGGFGEDNDMFGSGTGGLDLSNFDFSTLTGGLGGDGAAAGGSGGVDLSSFLTNFAPTGETEGDKDNAGS